MSSIDRGILPSINDSLAGAIIIATYLVRIASAGSGGWSPPWWLTVTTDVVLPIFAALWLFAAASYALFRPLS